MREIFDYLRQQTESRTGSRSGTHGGAVAAVHRADAALRLNLHLHALVLDGVYSVRGNEEPVFHPLLEDPGYEQVASIAGRVADKIRELMRRRGVLPTEVPEAPEAPEALPLEQRVAAGPPVVGVERRTRVEVDANRTRGVEVGQVASRSGVRIRAGSAVEPDARDALVRLANYVTRPEPTGPSIDARTLDLQTEGNILHKLERPFADGTTHVEFSPEALAARLREVTPGPRTPRVQYHGILAPRAAHRWRVVPGQLALFDPSEVPRQRPSEDGDDLPRPRPARVSPGRVKPGDPALRCPRCRIPMEVNTVEEHAEIEQAG